MSAAPALAPVEAWFPSNASNREWAALSAQAPQLVATMRRYLLQLTTFLAPRSVEVADTTLRQLARWLTTETEVAVVNEITRGNVEGYKVWLAAQPGQKGQLLAKNTQRHRLRMIRIFLERLIEWDWPDAPARNPILHGDIPPRSEPIPKFLTDQQAAAFMAAARSHPVARYRLVAQVLARTGLRASELCELAADAVTRIGTDGYWLRVPVGKLRNDRMIPLHPEVVDLFAEWTATNSEHIRRSRRLLADHHDPIDRRSVHRIIARIGAIAGIDDMHPHRLRHTLATQAINRGMRLEAIAALLGHYAGERVKREHQFDSGGFFFEAGEEAVEDLLATHLSFGGGVVALALQGGPELDGRLEERARLADRLEVAVETDGPGAVAVAEHPLVHLGAQLAHLGTLSVGGQFPWGVVERFDLLGDREVLVGDGAVGDAGIHHRHAHRAMPQ
jgi:site-specific recombinase XerD